MMDIFRVDFVMREKVRKYVLPARVVVLVLHVALDLVGPVMTV